MSDMCGDVGGFVDELTLLHETMNMDVVRMGAKEHDRYFSIISHSPHMLSYSFAEAVFRVFDGDIKYRCQSFNDMTRTAFSNDVMWSDIFIDNSENLLSSLNEQMVSLGEFRDLILSGDKKSLRSKILDIVKTCNVRINRK